MPRCSYCGETFGAGGVEPGPGDPAVFCDRACEVAYHESMHNLDPDSGPYEVGEQVGPLDEPTS